jgi:hypothetical protein
MRLFRRFQGEVRARVLFTEVTTMLIHPKSVAACYMLVTAWNFRVFSRTPKRLEKFSEVCCKQLQRA